MDSFQLKSQTGHSSQWSTCLTCWRSQNVSKFKELALQYFRWGSTESESCLDVHLISTFVLRKILNYPERECVKMMEKTCGKSPGDWFVLCEPCLKVAYQAWCLQVQICKLESQLKKVQNSVIAQLQENSLDSWQSPNKIRGKGTINVREVIRSYFNEQTYSGSAFEDLLRASYQNPAENLDSEACLICRRSQNTHQFKQLVSQYFQTWGSNDTKSVTESCLDSHLVSIFVLRKLLNYPKTKCDKILKRSMGTSPGDWFVLCEPCLKCARSAWRLHTQICKLKNQLHEIQKSARAQLEGNNQGWDCGLSIDYISFRESAINVREEIRNFFKEQMYRDSLSLTCGVVSKNNEDTYSANDDNDPLFSADVDSQGTSSEEDLKIASSKKFRTKRKKTDELLSKKSKANLKLKRSSVKKEVPIKENSSSSDDKNDKSDTDYLPAPSPVKRKIGRPRKLPSLSSTDQKLRERKNMGRPPTKIRYLTCKRKPGRPPKDNFATDTQTKSPKRIKPPLIIPADINRNGLSAGVLIHQPLDKPLRPPVPLPPKTWRPERSSYTNLIKGIDSFTCKICGKSLKSKVINQGIRSHMKLHEAKDNRFFCQICNYPSSSLKALEMHMTKYHPPDNSTQSVSELESTCANRDELVKVLLRSYHSVTIRKEKGQHDCPLCKETIIGGKIRSHIHLHGVKYQEFECKLCLHPSQDQAKFHFHMARKHKNDLSPEQLEAYNISKNEPISGVTVCYICGRNYSNKYALKNHLRVAHDVQDSVNCTKCSASFGDGSSLRVHMKKEHGEGRVMCDICGKDYRDQTALKAHLKDVHRIVQKNEPIYCPICDVSLRFQSQTHLEVHIRKKHPIIITDATDNYHDGKDKIKIKKKPCTKDNDNVDVTDVNIPIELTTDKKVDQDNILHIEPTRNSLDKLEASNEEQITEPEDKKLLVPDEDNLHCENDEDSSVKQEKDTLTNQPRRQKNVCGQCGLTFMLSWRLTKHIRDYHSGGEKARFSQRVCEFCGAVCVNLRGLQFHRREAHKEFFIFKCETCNLGFVTKGHLKTHLRTVARCVIKEKCVRCSVIVAKFKMAKHLEKCAAAPVLQEDYTEKAAAQPALKDDLEKAPAFDTTITPNEVHATDNLTLSCAKLTSVKSQMENDTDNKKLPTEGLPAIKTTFLNLHDVKLTPLKIQDSMGKDFGESQTLEEATNDGFDFDGIGVSDGGAFSDDDNDVECSTKVPDDGNRFFEYPHEARLPPPPSEAAQIHVPRSHEEKLWDSHEEPVNSIEDKDNIIVDDIPLPMAPPGPKRKGRPPKLFQPEKNWQCKLCFSTFLPSHKAAYLQHVKNHSLYKATTCTICSYQCKSSLNLEQHMTTHATPTPTSSARKIRFVHSPSNCPTCGYRCKLQSNMERHRLICDNFDQLATTTANGTFRCNKCKKRFVVKHKTIFHLLRCDKKAGQLERQQCHMCHRNFPNLYALESHIKDMHVATNCDICNQRFSSFRAVYRHKNRMHFNKKKESVICELCGLHFSLKTKLEIHVGKFHSDPDEAAKSQRKCKYCDVICVNTRALRYHTKAAHLEVFKFKCEICGDVHLTKRNLEYHVEVAHCDNKVKCSQCSMLIPSYTIKRHMRHNCVGKSE